MTRIFQILIIGLISFAAFAQNEISLFDSQGIPVAYIDLKDDSTIYTWDGYPTAYLSKDGNDLHIYGFNGKHLGWYENGIIYTQKGRIVGFVKDAVMIFTQPEPYKPIRKFAPPRLYKDVVPFKPYYTQTFAKRSLSSFLQDGLIK